MKWLHCCIDGTPTFPSPVPNQVRFHLQFKALQNPTKIYEQIISDNSPPRPCFQKQLSVKCASFILFCSSLFPFQSITITGTKCSPPRTRTPTLTCMVALTIMRKNVCTLFTSLHGCTPLSIPAFLLLKLHLSF